MWDNLIGREIRRSTRNVIFWNLLLLAAVGAVFIATSHYLYALCAGPFQLDTRSLLAEQEKKRPQWNYVTVTGMEALRTGWRDVTHTVDRSLRVKEEKATAAYSLLLIGDKFLVVRHQPEMWPAATCSGQLLPLPHQVRKTFIEPTTSQHPEAKAKFLNVMLDQVADWRGPCYVVLAVGTLFALFALRNLARAFRFRANPEQHPQLKQLANNGDLEKQLADMEQQTATAERFRNIRLLPQWLLQSKHFGFDLLALGDLVWGTMLVVQYRVYAVVPAGKRYKVVLHDLNRRKYECEVGSEAQGMQLLEGIVTRVPWVLIGGKDLQTAWRKSPSQVMAAVAERREAYVQHLLQCRDAHLAETAKS